METPARQNGEFGPGNKNIENERAEIVGEEAQGRLPTRTACL